MESWSTDRRRAAIRAVLYRVLIKPPRHAFRPPPRVDSAVLVVRRR